MTVIRPSIMPFPRQMAVLVSNAFNTLFLGGIGSGKTITGVLWTIAKAAENDRSDGAILTPTYPMFRDVVLPAWRQIVPQCLYKYKANVGFELWTGQQIFIRSCTDPERIRGLNIGYGWADEIALVNDDMAWKILQGRTRCVNAVSRGLLATTTPKGYNWLAKLFLTTQATDNYKTVRCRTSDNPHLDPEWIARIREDFGDEYARQELDAEIIEMAGLVWRIMPRIHCGMSERNLDVRSREFIGSVDWGWTNATGIVIAAKGLDDEIYVHETWKKSHHTTEQVIGEMRRLAQKYGVERWWADPADPEAIHKAKRAGFNIKGANKHPGPKRRMSMEKVGYAEVRARLQVRGNGRPRLYFNPELCADLLVEAEDLHYRDDDLKERVDHGKHGQDLCDALRYLVHMETERPRTRGWIV